MSPTVSLRVAELLPVPRLSNVITRWFCASSSLARYHMAEL